MSYKTPLKFLQNAIKKSHIINLTPKNLLKHKKAIKA